MTTTRDEGVVEDQNLVFQDCNNQDSRSCPWLLYTHEMSSCNQTFYNVAKDRFCVKEILEFKGKYVCGSSYGWLVMIDAQDSDCFLFNPFSFQKLKLPPREPNSGNWCILSSPPTDKYSCSILFLDNNDKSRISFCRLGDTEWNELVYTDERFFCFTVVKKKFYFISFGGSLLELNFSESDDGKSFEIIRITEGGLGSSELILEAEGIKICLIESCENLFAIVETSINTFLPRIGALEVFKMDFSRSEWVPVESLGDFAFFINHIGMNSMSRCASEVGVKANSIYMISDCDRTLRRYDMEERCIYQSLPCPNLDPQWEEIEDSVPIWL